MRLLPSAAGLLALLDLSAASTITLYLPSTPAPASLSPRAHATLSAPGLRLSAPLSDAHAFVFRNVTAGSYLVDVHCPSDGFAPLRVDVSDEAAVQAWETFRGNDWDNKGEALTLQSREDGSSGFEVRALGRKTYFMERPKFSVMSILMNPMILMGLVSMVIFIGLPKLVENMDPETRAEWEASQKENPMNSILGGAGQQQANPLGNFDMAAFMAGSKKKEGGGGQGAATAASGAESKANKPQGVRR
ncbi:hypothetical protein ISF_01796 [Cordyceps fumosorosea ARSEF 2679]|uniref:ER membrane protein complex subunit 7 beta-sandwich domain-containing protein n=1 Tax=Cordyceps fumosorosea (strain ARSEF 2679) TaxID=1081104 RepID=A0A168CD58_CORFA|nr:hypothetical protein ISF_01796 [Cordyceps fumosorosea ARSEF 2679]OAA71245.1 hypothetical protein ISF_01796 [Cordyceps fumosorosea ARSEF 2679]